MGLAKVEKTLMFRGRNEGVESGRKRGNKLLHEFGSVQRARGEAETFSTNGNSGSINGLDVDTVLIEKQMRHDFAEMGVSDQERHDMSGGRKEGKVGV